MIIVSRNAPFFLFIISLGILHHKMYENISSDQKKPAHHGFLLQTIFSLNLY